MRKQYDFRAGRRGPVLRPPSGKTRITIRIDEDVLQWFREQVHKAGGGSYQTLINDSLRKVVESEENALEGTVRRVVREELSRYGVERVTGRIEEARRRSDRVRPARAAPVVRSRRS